MSQLPELLKHVVEDRDAEVDVAKRGDEVVVEIEGLGNLTNPVRKE